MLMSVMPLFFAGCGSTAQDSALIGAIIGTGIGAIAGGDMTSMALGGSIGGGIGYYLGTEQEKKDALVAENQQYKSLKNTQDTQNTKNAQDSRDYQVVWVKNTNGSTTPVRMTKTETGYVGPRSEHYASLPTSDQLKPAYGF